MAVGIIACCLATLKPLLRSFLDWSDASLGGSTGNVGSRMMDGLSTRRRTGGDDETMYELNPGLRIVGFTTIITSNGRQASPPHSSVNRSIDIKSETWYTPADDTSGKAVLIEPEPVYNNR